MLLIIVTSFLSLNPSNCENVMRTKTNMNVRQYILIRLTKNQTRSSFHKPYWGHTIIIEACMTICGKWSQMTQLGFNFLLYRFYRFNEF